MSVISTTSVTNSSVGSTSDSSLQLPTKALGQSDFLKLLSTQLSTQDPLNPVKDTDFIAQLAQFSALQQNQAINANTADMRSTQAFATAAQLVGKTVELQVSDTATLTGVVTGMKMDSGVPKLVVNGAAFDLSQVNSVTQTGITNN